MNAAPEFSRPIRLVRLGKGPLRQETVADSDERAALVRRLDLVALDRLSAVVELARQSDGTVLLTAAFSADFVQSCVVTGDPVAGTLSENFMLRYGSVEHEPETGAEENEPAFEPLSGDVIDIGEAVAQELALALPPFPRIPGVSVETELGADAKSAREPGPFSNLAHPFGRGDG